jgi:hypothetical protein
MEKDCSVIEESPPITELVLQKLIGTVSLSLKSISTENFKNFL